MEQLLWVSVLALLSAQGPAGSRETCFPGEQRTVSPTGRHVISYRWQTDELYFQRSGKGTPVRLITFLRGVCVLWSPAGDYFALTLEGGSNVAKTEIRKMDDLATVVPVSSLLPAAVKELTADSSHAYERAELWDREGLVVRIEGRRNDGTEFDVSVRCRPDRSNWSCEMNDRK